MKTNYWQLLSHTLFAAFILTACWGSLMSKKYEDTKLNTMKTEFKLTGLSKPKSFTCETKDGEIFWANSEMQQDRFDALFNYCKGGFMEGKSAIIEHDGFFNDGIPVNPQVIEIKEN